MDKYMTSAIIGTSIAIVGVVDLGALLDTTKPTPKQSPVAQQLSVPTPPQPTPEMVQEYRREGNVVISMNETNKWIYLPDYSYIPQVQPTFTLTSLSNEPGSTYVIYDAKLMCVGRLTNDTQDGQYTFVFVETDYVQCEGLLPKPAAIPQPTNQTKTAQSNG